MSVIQKMLLKIIDEEIDLILIKQKQYYLDSFVRWYHAYMGIWTPKVGEKKIEVRNWKSAWQVCSCYCVGIVGHVSKNLSKIFHQFLKIPNCTIGCKVTGKRVNHGAGYGLEIPVQYKFIGAEKAVEWA